MRVQSGTVLTSISSCFYLLIVNVDSRCVHHLLQPLLSFRLPVQLIACLSQPQPVALVEARLTCTREGGREGGREDIYRHLVCV